MKIGIDARFLTHPQCGGFKTYTEGLIAALGQIDRQNSYILYVGSRPGPKVIPPASNFEVRRVKPDVPLIGMPLREQFLLPHRAWRDQLDLFHSPCLSAPLRMPCPLVVTVHDMIWHRSCCEPIRGSLRQWLFAQYYWHVVDHAVRRAAATITVSEFSKRQIVSLLGTPGNQVFVTHEAAASSFSPVLDLTRREAVRSRYNLPANFIMAIGAADPRKNVHTLINAYRLLPQAVRDNYPLVVMWSRGSLAEQAVARIEELGLAGQVLSRQLSASNEEMATLYSLASLFVFPSLHEGFGLPPLEAMACGVPVVAADNSSMPEVLGDAAYYTRAADPAEMANAIAHVLTNEALKTTLRSRGLWRAALFSWQECARQTLSVYRRVALGNALPPDGCPGADIDRQLPVTEKQDLQL